MKEAQENAEKHKKSFEIAYLLCRISQGASKSFADIIESNAMLFLNSVYLGNYMETRKLIFATDGLLRLLGSIGAIEERNIELILKNLNSFSSLISNIDSDDKIDLERIIASMDERKTNIGKTHEKKEDIHGEEVKPITETIRNRQSAIEEIIKKFGNCRMKEIQEAFPDVSERTLRYDLQNLVADGTIERIGNAGPATFYRVVRHNNVPPEINPNGLIDELEMDVVNTVDQET